MNLLDLPLDSLSSKCSRRKVDDVGIYIFRPGPSKGIFGQKWRFTLTISRQPPRAYYKQSSFLVIDHGRVALTQEHRSASISCDDASLICREWGVSLLSSHQNSRYPDVPGHGN